VLDARRALSVAQQVKLRYIHTIDAANELRERSIPRGETGRDPTGVASPSPGLMCPDHLSGSLSGVRDQARLYLDVIMMALPPAIRQILEARMQHYEYQSDFARKYYGQGREEGRQQGREEGRQEGREEGREDGLRAAVVALEWAPSEVTYQPLRCPDCCRTCPLPDDNRTSIWSSL
jgi:flagellar biosynthesis/type III secretory pathway protein FliH